MEGIRLFMQKLIKVLSSNDDERILPIDPVETCEYRRKKDLIRY